VIRLICILLWLLPLPAFAAGGMMPDIVFAAPNVSAPAYTGPGDIVASATAWYGLRAYSSSQVAGTTKAVNLRRASDNTTCDFDINTSGNLGGTDAGCGTGTGLSLATFATQDATATCTIATNSASCVSASSTPHAGSTITGAGVTNPCYAISVGTFTGGSGTVTLGGNVAGSPCGTIGAGVTLTFTYGLFVPEWYDQTGNGHHLIQATAGNQFELLPNCLASLPCLSQTTTTQTEVTSATFTPTAVGTLYNVTFNLANGAANAGMLLENGSNNRLRITGAAATWSILGGASGSIVANASNAAFHVAIGVLNGASSVLSIDGTSTTGTATGNTTAGTIGFGTNGNPNSLRYTEAGVWDTVAFTSGNLTSLCHNAFTYWGTSTSC